MSDAYAPWWRRVVATLLDSALLIPFLVAQYAGFDAINTPANSAGTQTAGFAVLALATAGAVGFVVWNSVLRQGRTGSSLGKERFDLVVVSAVDGDPVGGWVTLGRQVMHVLDALACFVGYLWPLWDGLGQTFADKVMNTVVLHLPLEDA